MIGVVELPLYLIPQVVVPVAVVFSIKLQPLISILSHTDVKLTPVSLPPSKSKVILLITIFSVLSKVTPEVNTTSSGSPVDEVIIKVSLTVSKLAIDLKLIPVLYLPGSIFNVTLPSIPHFSNVLIN